MSSGVQANLLVYHDISHWSTGFNKTGRLFQTNKPRKLNEFVPKFVNSVGRMRSTRPQSSNILNIITFKKDLH